MTTSDKIAAMAFGVSLIALVASYYIARWGIRQSSRPVLVFSMVSTYKWRLYNVGTGPAINVVVADFAAQRRPDSLTTCYPIAAGGYIDLPWVRGGWELAAIYTDVFGAESSTLCSSNQNTISSRNILPGLVADTDQSRKCQQGVISEPGI